MSPDRFTLTIDPPRAGLMCFRFHFPDAGDHEFLVSYLSEPLTDLLVAASTIARGHGRLASPIRMNWVEEPGSWIVTISSADGDDVIFEVAEFPTWPAPPSASGTPLMNARVSGMRFSRSVLRATDTMIAAIGAEDYLREWRRRFPSESLDRLREAIGSSDR